MEDARRARGGHTGSQHKSKSADQRGCGADLYVAIPEQDAATSCSYHQHSAIHLSDQRGATTMQDHEDENQNEDEHDDVLEHDMSKGTSCEHLGRASLMLAEEQIAADIRELHVSPTTNASFFMKLRIKEHEKAVLTKIVRVLQEWVIIVSLLICVVYWAGLHRQEEYTPITSNLYIEKKITAQGPFGRWEARVTVENLQELELLQDMNLLMEDAFVAERAAPAGLAEYVQPGDAGLTPRWRLEDFVSKKRGRGHGETAADRARVAATRALVAQYVADYSANSNPQNSKPFRYPLVKKLFDHSKQRRQAAFVLTVLEHGIIVFASLTELLLVKQSFTFGRMALLLLCLIFYCIVNAAWTLAEGYPIYPIILDWVESPVLSLGFIVLLTLVFCGIYWLLMRFCSTPRTVNGAAGKMLKGRNKGMNGARKRSGVSSFGT
eukprot:g8852.t1